MLLKGYDEKFRPISTDKQEIVLENGIKCTVETFEERVKMVTFGSSGPAVREDDIFSRQYVTSAADLTPVIGSRKPSVAVLLTNSTSAADINLALCESFKELKTIKNVSKRVDVKDQVVTKWLVKKQPNLWDGCKSLLKNYNYEIAKEELQVLNKDLLRTSTGPFIAIYNPDSTKINHLIDLNGTSEQKIKEFGDNWGLIFTEFSNSPELEKVTKLQSAGGIKSSKDIMTLWSTVFKYFKATVCVVDPNLAYLLHEGVGRVVEGAICTPKG